MFTLLTFNMQCSSSGTRHEQLLQLVEIIKAQKFECVCLQDVNLTSLSILKSKLHKYTIIEALSNGTPQVIIYSNNCKMEEEFWISYSDFAKGQLESTKMADRKSESSSNYLISIP